MSTLKELSQQHFIDKGDSLHSLRGVSFLDIYESYFAGRRDEVKQVLEIGVLHGNSLRVWRNYFPNAFVHGLDIDASVRFSEERIDVTIGDQSDAGLLASVGGRSAMFDVVIDDGSHVLDHVLASLAGLWPRLAAGGLYFIEDTACSYGDISGSTVAWPGQQFNAAKTNYCNDRKNMDSVLRARIREMDHLQGDCAFVHFWPMLIAMQKVR